VVPQLVEERRAAERDGAAGDGNGGELEHAQGDDAAAIHGTVIAGACVLPPRGD
jgi:hypothetical protein